MSKTKRKVIIENLFSIERMEVDLSPGPKGFVGPNAVGKTNVLKAFNELISGKNDPEKIMKGCEKAIVKLEIYDEDDETPNITVQRVQTEKGSKLTAKGLPKGTTPKVFLKSLMDEKMLNPVKLISEDAVNYLKEHLHPELVEGDIPKEFLELGTSIEKTENPFDLCLKACAWLEVTRENTYKDMRHKKEVWEDLKEKTSAKLEPLPFSYESVSENLEKINQRIGKANEAEERKKEIKSLILGRKQDIEMSTDEIEEQENKIKLFKRKIFEAEEKIKSMKGLINKNKEEILNLEENLAEVGITDISTLEKERAKQHGFREQLRARDILEEKYTECETKEKEYNFVAGKYETLDRLFKHFAYNLPKELIGRCKLPVKGVTFKYDKETKKESLWVGETRFDLLSEAERALASVKIVEAIAKEKNHVIISLDGLEQMDKKHRKEFHDLAKQSELSILYTRVGTPENEDEILISNGGETITEI